MSNKENILKIKHPVVFAVDQTINQFSHRQKCFLAKLTI